jgi:hypothetical protein
MDRFYVSFHPSITPPSHIHQIRSSTPSGCSPCRSSLSTGRRSLASSTLTGPSSPLTTRMNSTSGPFGFFLIIARGRGCVVDAAGGSGVGGEKRSEESRGESVWRGSQQVGVSDVEGEGGGGEKERGARRRMCVLDGAVGETSNDRSDMRQAQEHSATETYLSCLPQLVRMPSFPPDPSAAPSLSHPTRVRHVR